MVVAVPSLADERAALAALARLRTEEPVGPDAAGVWHVVRDADVRALLRDTDAFAADLAGVLAGQPAPAGSLLHDPPEHRMNRALVGQAFTPRRVADLAPRIRAVTDELLDAAGSTFDLVPALADPLPLTVIAELLGLSDAERADVRGWMTALGEIGGADPFADPATMARVVELMGPFVARMAEVCRRRRDDPGDDLVSALVAAELDGRRLDDTAAGSFAMTLFMAGHATTAGLIGNAVRTLDERPELWARLHADRSLVPAFLDEVLRLRPTLARVQRATTRDVELGGVTIPARSVVVAWLLAANHDPAAFPEPELVDLGRRSAGIAFGHGPHACLGAPLARLEGRIVLEALLDRYERLVVEPGPDGLGAAEQLVLTVARLPVRAVPLRS